MIEPKSRGVLDHPPSRVMTALCGVTLSTVIARSEATTCRRSSTSEGGSNPFFVSAARWIASLTLAMTLLRLVRCHEHPRRAVDHLSDAIGRGCGGSLEHERQEQRRLTHLQELRRCELAVVDGEIAGCNMRPEIIGEAVDGFFQHVRIIAAADLRHPLGDRHHGADPRAAA